MSGCADGVHAGGCRVDTQYTLCTVCGGTHAFCHSGYYVHKVIIL